MKLFKPRGKHAPNAKAKAEAKEPSAEEAALEKAAEAEGEALPEDEATVSESGDRELEGEDEGSGAQNEQGDEEPEDTSAVDDDEGSGDEDEAVEGPDEVIAPLEESTADFAAAGFSEIPEKKRHRGLKVFGITLGAIVLLAAVAYFVGVVVFMGRMLPNVMLGDYDVSLKSDAEVAQLLDGVVSDYQLDVTGGGFAYRTTGLGIGLAIDANRVLRDVHSNLDAWRWPLLIIEQGHDETECMNVTFRESVYAEDVAAAVAKFNETARPPVNATIAYDDKNDKFIVKPEEAGTQLDVKAVLSSMADSIEQLETKLPLSDEQLIQPQVFATDEKLIEAAELATGMVSAHLTLLLGGQPVGEVDGETLSAFVTIDENLEVVFKDDEMNAWVDSLAASFNTAGTERVFTRADGKQIAVAGGIYGWEVDTEALKGAVLEGIKAGGTAQIEIPCLETAAVFNGANQRDWGNRYIDVDINEQHVRFYGDDGSIIWEADCISGSPDGSHDTWTGVWRVNAKESPSKLIGYENGKKIYETTVTYWMPFEGNGIGFHDATWQPSFGGSMYANGYGSHGCVNLSYENARSLYDIIQIGDVVVVHK